MVNILVKGNDSTSSLTLLTAYKIVPESSDKDYRKKAVKEFEEWVVKKIKQ